MKILARILCQIAALAVVIAGLHPLVKVIKQGQPNAHLGFYDTIYFDYNSIQSVIILLVAIAAAIIFLWLGSRLKSTAKTTHKSAPE